MFVRRVIRAAAVVVLVAAAGCRKGEEAEAPAARVVARVADRQITAADVYRGLYPQGRPKEAKVDAEAARRVLDQLVERALILEWAGDNEIGAGDDEVNGRLGLIRADYGPRGFSSYLKSQGLTLDSFTEIIRDDLVVEAAIEAAVVEEVSVSYDDVVAYYNVHAEDFEALAEYHIKQIITDEKAKAEEALAKLEYGATFEEVAREMSMSPDRHMGGDVGYTTLDAVPPEVAEVVADLPPGRVSGVIETAYGFEIIKAVGVRDARRKPLPEVRTEIEDRLRTEREDEVYAAWLQQLRKNAKISIDEKALKEL